MSLTYHTNMDHGKGGVGVGGFLSVKDMWHAVRLKPLVDWKQCTTCLSCSRISPLCLIGGGSEPLFLCIWTNMVSNILSMWMHVQYVRLIVLLAPLSVHQPISCMDHAWGHCIILCSSIYNYNSRYVLGMCVYSILKHWVEERKGKQQPTDQSQRLADP